MCLMVYMVFLPPKFRKGTNFGKCSQGSFSYALKTKAANSAKEWTLTVEKKYI